VYRELALKSFHLPPLCVRQFACRRSPLEICQPSLCLREVYLAHRATTAFTHGPDGGYEAAVAVRDRFEQGRQKGHVLASLEGGYVQVRHLKHTVRELRLTHLELPFGVVGKLLGDRLVRLIGVVVLRPDDLQEERVVDACVRVKVE
jgi:hypothetical protein